LSHFVAKDSVGSPFSRGVWVPLVVVVVIAVGGVHGFTAVGGLRPLGTVADINHLDDDAQPHRLDAVTLAWSLELVTTLTEAEHQCGDPGRH
jgi:hypothetical protein